MRRRTLALLLALVVTIGLFAGCGGSAGSTGTDGSGSTAVQSTGGAPAAPAPEGKDTLIVGIPDAPIYMDPHVNSTTATFRITTNMFDRLVQLNGDMEMVPKLAESWEVEDDKTTVFHLRQGVKFHNDEEMTAEDVKYSLERTIASPGVNYNYLIISDIEIVDDYTIKIITSEPFNALLYRLTLDAASIVSKTAAEEGEEAFNKHPVGAGPYKFVSWETGGDVTLEAHEDYWASAPEIKTVIFRQIPEAINRVIGLETGEIDLAYDLAATDLETVRSNDNLRLEEKPSLAVYFLGFNTEKTPLNDPRVRQAVAYALNKQDFMDIVFSGSADDANYTVVTPKLNGYAPPDVDYTYSIEKAKELLADAGYPDGFDSTLWCNDALTFRDGAVVVQDQLRQIGINLEIKSQEMGSFFAETAKGEHDFILFYKLGIDPDSVMRSVYHSASYGQTGNRFFWSTPEVDAMLDEANQTLDGDRALELYKDIQQTAGDELPFIPICSDYLNAGMQSYVEGFDLYPGQTHSVYGTHFAQ